MGHYYSLVAGLPDLLPDDPKLRYSMSAFRAELEEHLSGEDLRTLGIFFLRYDNENLLKLFYNHDAELDTAGQFSAEDLLGIIRLFTEIDRPAERHIPPYFHRFLPAFLSDQKVIDSLSWEDQLSSLYFDYATGVKNRFIASWFNLNLNVTNILTALNCRKYGWRVDQAVIGDNEISDAIRSSHAKDFGLLPLFPEVDEVLRLADEEDLFERERKTDLFKWAWLEEHGFFHYFDVERLFIYLVRLDMLERWSRLEKSTGRRVFREMVVGMQKSFEFPAEFKLVKIKK